MDAERKITNKGPQHALISILNVPQGPKGQQLAAVQRWLQGPSGSSLYSSHSESLKHLQGIDEAVLRNIQACNELSDLVRTSFGPNGSCSPYIQPQPPLNPSRKKQTCHKPSRKTFRDLRCCDNHSGSRSCPSCSETPCHGFPSAGARSL